MQATNFILNFQFSDKQVKQTEYAFGAALCAAVAMIAAKTGQLAVVERALPE
jgi:hypothetical protein